MSQMSTAIGMLIWLSVPNSIDRRASTAAGNSLPTRMPAPMHRATQRVRNRSKKLSRFFSRGRPAAGATPAVPAAVPVSVFSCIACSVSFLRLFGGPLRPTRSSRRRKTRTVAAPPSGCRTRDSGASTPPSPVSTSGPRRNDHRNGTGMRRWASTAPPPAFFQRRMSSWSRARAGSEAGPHTPVEQQSGGSKISSFLTSILLVPR